MDKRLKLTKEQKLAIEDFKKACRELEATNTEPV